MRHRSHGDGYFRPEELGSCGADCIFERDVLIFHPKNVHLGTNVYVGHRSILKGYHDNQMRIGDETWIGQNCFFHSAGGLNIGVRVGIGPGVIILTSSHAEHGRALAPLSTPIETAEVIVEDEVNIGVGAILLPGVHIGRGAKIGAGSVVTKSVAAYAIVAGNPAAVIRERP